MNSIDNANNAPRCEHIKFDGHRCAAPALHGRRACRFHFGIGDCRASFPIIDDGLSLQVALNQIARAILDGSLERRTATTLLYCFQIMSTNLKQMNAERKLSLKDEEDDLPGPSLAEILLDKLEQFGIEHERSAATTPVTQNSTSVIPSAAEGPFVSPSASSQSPIDKRQSPMPSGSSSQSSIDNRQSAMPLASPRSPASPAVKEGVLDKLEACAESRIKNRKSKMLFGPSRSASVPPLTQNSAAVIPSAAEGPCVSSRTPDPAVIPDSVSAPQSSFDTRQAAMPLASPRSPASPAVKEGVLDKLEACAESRIKNRKSKMLFVPRSTPYLKPDTRTMTLVP